MILAVELFKNDDAGFQAWLKAIEQYAWAAGIIDGEGCVCIVKDASKHGWSPSYRLRLSVGMTHRPTVEKLHEIFNVGRVRATKNHIGKNWRPVFDWYVYGNEADQVLRLIKPYAITKSQHIEIAERFSAREKSPGRIRVTPEMLEERETMYQQMKSLNPKGRT